MRRGIVFERTGERGISSHCHICGRKVSRPETSVVLCKVHGRMHAYVNASMNILAKKTRVSVVRDGEKTSLAWIVMRWNLNRWQSHAESAEYRDLQAAA